MNFFTGFFKAIGNCFKGFSLLFEKGLWPYLFYSVGLWLLMWIGSIWVFAEIASQLANYLNQQLNFEENGKALEIALKGIPSILDHNNLMRE